MFHQLINPIKLEALTNFYICLAEQNILQTLTSCTQSRNGITLSPEIQNQYRMRFLKDLLPIASLMFLIILESNFLLD